MNSSDPYGRNIFAHDPHRDGPGARRPRSQAVHVEIGMVLEDVASGWVGAVTRVEKSGGIHLVELEDRRGVRRSFPLGPGFWVEGRHDAELVQHVWGEDLAEAGIAVQLLEGVDNLEAVLDVFGPTDTARAGVLVDHMVPGSKESRIAEAVSARWPGAVLVLGHPFVDIWQAVKPARVGLERWPDIPRGIDIKHGTLDALGWPHADQRDIAMGWKRILSTVRTYRDLEPALLGRVEELIDFVTVPWAQ